MANSDKNIVITPSVGLSSDPSISFTGLSNKPLTLKITEESFSTLSFESGSNRVFSITSNNSGDLFKLYDESQSVAINVPKKGSIEIRNKLVAKGKGIKLPAKHPVNAPKATEGLLIYDTFDKTLKYSTKNTWYPLPSVGLLEGLVGWWDPADRRSYPGYGNIWYDISGNGHHLTLGASVSWQTLHGGVFRFIEDGNSYARNSSLNLSAVDNTTITFSRKTSGSNDGRVVTALNNNWLLGHHDTTYGDYYAQGWVNDIGSPASDTIWRSFTGTGDKTNDIWDLYINGKIHVTNNAGDQGPNGFNIGGQYGQSSLAEVAFLACWNRRLSSSEIEQIHELIRNRFWANA